MDKRDGHRGVVLAKSMTGALLIAAGVAASPGVAHAAPLFNGTYTVVQKSFTIDVRTGARMEQPDRVELWIVSSTCALSGCVAEVVKTGEFFNMVFTGDQWNRLAVPRTGTCRGATVPARAAAMSLVPQSDGSLSGAATLTVDCDGVLLDSSLPLTVTPS